MAEILTMSSTTARAPARRGSSERVSLENFLRKTGWFEVLSPLAQDRVLADCGERTYEPRGVVAQTGEVARSWIGVIDGLLKVESQSANERTVMLAAVPADSWVGEGSVIKKECRRYDIVALRSTRVAHVPRATFMWLLETSTDFSRFIIDHLNERVGQFIASTELLRIDHPPARVAAAICNLFNPVLCPTARPLLNIWRGEIGELAGLSRPTTNVALKRLEELLLVRVDYGALLVVDLSGLRAFSAASSPGR